jgi:hypothetical protein
VPEWRVYYRSATPLAGVGFHPGGARVIDVRGGLVDIEPPDVDAWRAPG